MIRIGLTGGIAAGKSTIVRLLQTWKVPVFDADTTVHHLYHNKQIAMQLAELCPLAYKAGKIDRAILKQELVTHPAMLADIEAIIHPAVEHAELRFMKHCQHMNVPLACADIPLLFEGGNAHRFDVIWLVVAPLWLRKARILRRGTMNADMMEKILSRQWSDAQKIPLADCCVHSGIGRGFMAQEVKHAYLHALELERRITA